ncbi:MAG: hypothetical protein SPK77_10055, partial [Lachnospiraceae bacterium]|nr:hypothetical protein [Lachnospiraceae bacterium]
VLEVIGNWSFTERAWIGFAMCLVGNVLFIFFTRLVYRAPISQYIFRSMARKSVLTKNHFLGNRKYGTLFTYKARNISRES